MRNLFSVVVKSLLLLVVIMPIFMAHVESKVEFGRDMWCRFRCVICTPFPWSYECYKCHEDTNKWCHWTPGGRGEPQIDYGES